MKEFDKSVEFEEQLAAVTTACEVDYNGNTVYKDIHILVGFSLHLFVTCNNSNLETCWQLL